MAEQQELNLLHTDREYFIKKSNALIESRYRLSVEEQKLISLAASQLGDHVDDFDEINFLVSDIVKVFDKKNKNIYEQLDEVSSRLMTRVFEIRRSEKDWDKFQWVSRARLKNGVLTLKFSEDAKPFLLKLKDNYTRYELTQIANMTSGYGIRLFEHCKQYYAIGRRSFALSAQYNPNGWQIFQDAMGYEGASYDRYSNVKQKVVNVAVEQVKEHTKDFQDFECVELKRGKKVWGLEFTWRQRKGGKAEHIPATESSGYHKLVECGIDDRTARKIVSLHSDSYIQANLDYVINVAKKAPKDSTGYIISAINKNYANYAETSSIDTREKKGDTMDALLAELVGDDIRQRFVEEVIQAGDTATLNTFIKHRFNNPYIQELWSEFNKKLAN